MSEAGPRLNGPASPTGKYIDGIDPDDPEYIKNLQRPAEVKEDLQQMENRSRVSLVLNSQAFKDELEQVVEEQLRNGPYPASLIALQQITDLLLPHSKGSLGSLARAATVIPINDLRGVESLGFAKGEKLLRCKLAALYRIIDLCGWSHGIYNHISARISPDHEHFLLNPFGMLYSEITASSLIKVDVRGEIVEPGSTQLGVSKAGFTLHSAIHQARPDIKCIVHLHTPAAVAVSAMKCGLLPMSQEALICGKLSYHDYQGIFIDPEEREKLARNLGVHNKILILRNHGIVACGETIEEAFHFTFNVMAACEAQVKAVPAGLDNIVIPSEEAREQVYRTANQGGGGVESTGRKWKIGELEFEALMRTLDNSGYRTGYVYKLPFVKQEKKDRSNSEVEIPPASSSFTYVFDGDYEHSKYASPLKAAMDRHKKAYKAGWLTTPNAYKKTEVEEIGTTTPKKITKWVPESDSPNRPSGTPIKLENPNQFAPQGENPREFKQKQKSIKKDYYEEKVTAGPQSKILEGISWDEAQRAKDGMLSGAGDQLIVVGAASKGIIQRDHQHNAVVYRQYYAANPFENMSEAEIEQYQAEVQRREKGEPVQETVSEPSNVVLTSQQPPQIEQVHQPEPPREIQRLPETQKATEATKSSPPVEESSRISRSTPEPQQPREDKAINELADTVVQTVISDALSVLRRGKGQQILTGTEPLHQNSNSSQQSMGSQIINTKQTSSTSYQDKYSNDTFFRDTMKQTHRLGQCGTHSLQEKDDTFRTEIREDAAGAATEDLRWCASGASNPDDDFVTVQLKPVQLYHGQTSEGTMRVRFTIQSTVRRHFRADTERSGIIDGVDASISEPIVEMAGSSSQNEYCDGQNVFASQVRVRKESKHNGMNFAGETNTIGSNEATCTEANSIVSKTVVSDDGLKEEASNKSSISSHSENDVKESLDTVNSCSNSYNKLLTENSKEISPSQIATKFSFLKDIEECKLLYADDESSDEVEENISQEKQFSSKLKKSQVNKNGLQFKSKNETQVFPDTSTRIMERNICFDQVDDSFEKILLSPENVFVDSLLNEDLNLIDFIGAASFEEIEDVGASSLVLQNVKTVTCCEENEAVTSPLALNEGDYYNSQSNVESQQSILSNVQSGTLPAATPKDFVIALNDIADSDGKEIHIKEPDDIDLMNKENPTNDAHLVTHLKSVDHECSNSIVDTMAMEHGYMENTHLERDIIMSKVEPNLDIINPMSTDDTLSEKCNGKKETCIDEILPTISINEKDNIPISCHKNGKEIYSKQLVHLDEGPLQTSSPKLGRSKSKESPFKTYPKKLGKSEETLLDIMPLKSQKIKGVAKSQEELEDSKDIESHKELLSRTVSLGPHHKKKRHRNITMKRNAISKETVIDDNPVAGIADKGNLSPTKFALDRYNLMIHNEIMKLSNYASYFKPPDIIAYPLTSSTMPPLPDTTEVPSVSDTERSHRRNERSANSRADHNAIRPYCNPPIPLNPPPKREKARHHSEDVQEQGDNVPKRRWTPKQRKDRRVVSEEVEEKSAEKTSTEEASKHEVKKSSSSSIKESRHSGREERIPQDENGKEKSVRGSRQNKNETEERTRSDYKKDKRTERQESSESYVRPSEQRDETSRKRSTKSENQDDTKGRGEKEESIEEMIKRPSLKDQGKVFVKSRENYDVIKKHEQKKPQVIDISKDKRAVQVLPVNKTLQTEDEIKRKSATDKDSKGPMLTEKLTIETDLDDVLLRQQNEKLSTETDIDGQQSMRNTNSLKHRDIEKHPKKAHKKTDLDDQINEKKEQGSDMYEVQSIRKSDVEKEKLQKGLDKFNKDDNGLEDDRYQRKSYDRSRRNDKNKKDEKLEEDRDQRRSYDRGRRNDRDGEDDEERLEVDRDQRRSYDRDRRNNKDEKDKEKFEEDPDQRSYDISRRVEKDDESRLEGDRDKRRSYDRRARRNNRDEKDEESLEVDRDQRQSYDRTRRNRDEKDDEAKLEVDRDQRRSYDRRARRNNRDEKDESLEVDMDQRQSYDRTRRNRDEKDDEAKLEGDRDQRRSYERARRNRDEKDAEAKFEVERDPRRSYDRTRRNRDEENDERLEGDRDQRRSYDRTRKNNRDEKEDDRLDIDRDSRRSAKTRRNRDEKDEARLEGDRDPRKSYDRTRRINKDEKVDEKLEEDQDPRRSYDRSKRNKRDEKNAEDSVEVDRDQRRSYDRASRNDTNDDKRQEDNIIDKRKSYERTRKTEDTSIIADNSQILTELKKGDEIWKNENNDTLNSFQDQKLGNRKDENDNHKRRHHERGRKNDADVVNENIPNVIIKGESKRERNSKGRLDNEQEYKSKDNEVELKDNSASTRKLPRQDTGSREKEDKNLDKIQPVKSSVYSKNSFVADSDEDAPPVPPRFVSLEADDVLFKQSDNSIEEGAKRPNSKPRKSGLGKHIDTEDIPHGTSRKNRDLRLSIEDDQNMLEKRTGDKTKERLPEPRKRRSYLIEDDSDKYMPSKEIQKREDNFKPILPLETSKEFVVEKREHKELEPYMYARGRRSGRIPKRLDISREDAPDSESDNQLDDLDKLMPDNPIELNIDETNDDTHDTIQDEETPTKKGIFNLFSCVGGKSSDILKKKTKDKKSAKKYYDEGEKRKIKKLAKEKEKEEKNKLYFQDPEDATVENDFIPAVPDNEKKPLEEVESSDIVVADLPQVPDPRHSGRRYQKKQKSTEMTKPLSTFIDPIEVFEDVLGTNDEFEEVDDLPLGTFTRWKEDKVEEPKLSSFMSAKREEKQLNTFRNFGRRPYAQNTEDVPKNTSDSVDSEYNQDVKEESDMTATSRSSSSFLKMSSTSEEPVKLKGGCPDMYYLHDDSLDSDFESIAQSNQKSESNFPNVVQNKDLTESNFQNNTQSMHKPKSDFPDVVQANHVLQKSNYSDVESNAQFFGNVVEKLALASDLNGKIEDKKDECTLNVEPMFTEQNVMNSPLSLHSVEIRLEPPTPESTIGDSLEQFIDFCDNEKINVDHCESSLNPVCNVSSPHDDDHVLNISAPAFSNFDRHVLDVSHDLNNSFDPSASFEADMMYRRKHRTVSFDERLTAERNLSPSLVRKNSSSLIAEPVTRPRSSSTTSNPLTYEPWRAKAYKQQQHHRSFSASGMLYGRMGTRLHKSHSIGEIYNSTVASSVARRRAKTIVSSDITSRMYQPRQRSRSRALLGDASFGSVAPIRQRSFSGFDYATSAGSIEPESVTVKRSESERQTSKIQILEKEETKNVERSKSDRRLKHKEHGDVKPASPSKSDTLKSTDSASGGETLEDRSSKEGSPTKEHPSPTKEKKKKKKFRIPSFSKKKSKEHKESAM